MSSRTQADSTTSAANWGFWGAIGGTAVAVGVTAVGGAPISAWIITKCLFTGLTAGVATFAYKGVDKLERNADKAAATAAKVAAYTGQKADAFANTAVAGGVTLFSAGLSSLNYYTFGQDCKLIEDNNYCTVSKNVFYLTSIICAGAMLTTAALGIKYVTLSMNPPKTD